MTRDGSARRARRFTEVLSGLPNWVSLTAGVLAVLVGAILVVRPLTSLTLLALLIACAALVTGVGEVLGAREHSAWDAVLALGWIALGVLILIASGPAIDLIAPVVAIALVVGGVLRLLRARRGTTSARLVALLLGIAEIILGIVALRWPDVTLLIVAVLFGIRTVAFGVSILWDAVTGRRATTSGAVEPARSRWAASGRVLAAATALLIAVAAALTSAHLRSGTPRVDAFYTAPDEIPAAAGTLLRAEPFTRDVPGNARAWRILYTTTLDADRPALASAIVLVPEREAAEPLPVIAWAHGTTGYARPCAPSLATHPFESGALPALDQIVESGWALVATDYTGLGTEGSHPYLIGQGEGRSVLDAVRAARQLTDIRLADRTVVWGHSQGGHAALWAGLLAPGYAPEAGVIGVAAMAPASDAVGLVSRLPEITGGSVFASYVVAAYTAHYPDVDFNAYIDPAARTLVRQMSERCLAEPGVLVSVLSALSLEKDRPIFATDPLSGALGVRLRENIPAGALTVPVLLAQGAADTLVDPAVQSRYAAARCADGWNLDYRVYPGRDHIGVVAADSPLIPDLLGWTQQRLSALPQQPACPPLG
ncbi:lipase family protein [Nocardia sp. NPDC057668]|uniref:lipase family protein n=1 Tax=Nocardia sp. NPDC057668 TaxID=3346202 RepID=UPI00366A6CAF